MATRADLAVSLASQRMDHDLTCLRTTIFEIFDGVVFLDCLGLLVDCLGLLV